MGKIFYALVVAGIVLFAGLSLFPDMNTILNGTTTAGYTPMMQSAVTFLPYALVFFIIYLVYRATKHSNQ